MIRRTGLIDTDEKIIESLVFGSASGMSKQDLIQHTSFDQSTIYRRTKVLEKKGLVKILKKGQRTSYFLTSNVLKDNYISASIIGRISFNELIKKKMGINNYGFRFPSENNNQYYITNMKPGRDDLELSLFDFSINIGSLIVFLLIHSLGSDIDKYKNMNQIDRYNALKNFVEVIFQRLIFYLLGNKFFIKTIHQSINLLSLIDLKVEQGNLQNDFFDKRVFDKVMSSFEKIFPDTFNVMNKVIQELPKKIESEKELLKYANDAYVRSTKCKHEYGKQERNAGKTFQICERCGDIKIVRTLKKDLIKEEFAL